MKTKKTEKASASKSKKPGGDMNRARKMEPLKSKELKNQHFDSEDDDEDLDSEPETMEDDFKGFDDLEGMDEEEDDDF